jgi:hypothetical protein
MCPVEKRLIKRSFYFKPHFNNFANEKRFFIQPVRAVVHFFSFLFRRKKKRNEPKKRKNCGRENCQGLRPRTPSNN